MNLALIIDSQDPSHSSLCRIVDSIMQPRTTGMPFKHQRFYASMWRNVDLKEAKTMCLRAYDGLAGLHSVVMTEEEPAFTREVGIVLTRLGEQIEDDLR